MPQDKPVKLAILWHMHQPNYREPQSDRMVMPWVRLHALKDYLDMPLTAARFENVKVTFNLVPSLLEQIEIYLKGGTDPHLELSRMRAKDLDQTQKSQILSTFFSANPATMIRPHRRYFELYRKAKENYTESVLPALFSSAEIRDLQVWSNLAWVDPVFRDEPPVAALLAKGKHFTEEDKQQLLDWQLDLMRRIVPTYRELQRQGRIEISFTPYYHPILPLLCDTDVALEATPKIKLPSSRFTHPEDAVKQVEMSLEMFRDLFDRDPAGMWPSEGSVSEKVADIMMEQGIKWIATDEEILFNSLKKSGSQATDNVIHTVYEYGPGLKIFFRDHLLSDRIGFVYSAMGTERAVEDFISRVKAIREQRLEDLDNTVVAVILDGENAWEYFPQDGREFLDSLYRRLNDDPLIETVTFSEATETVKPRELKSLVAGSWINHNFRIWIGHPEDNAAWDLLGKTRARLVQFQRENPRFDRSRIEQAWNQIYVAEGSDWCWWYGDEHRGSHNEEFDRTYRRHLVAVYELLGLEVPFELLNPIYHSEAAIKAVLPDELITPQIDGRLTHFYEWAGAGFYDCRKAGGAMHRADRRTAGIHFAYDHDNVYIRLDFENKKNLDLVKKLKCRLTLFAPEAKTVTFDIGAENREKAKSSDYTFAFREILEISVKRSFIFENSSGELGLQVALLDGEDELESWPETDAITFDVPDAGREMFWP
ncbi:MAG: glycoside hydrolase [Candidatus Zixiibacteriota bacterium]|nr:MAG: glycoside hydrolase [candidate division Zixibacteria bacterium]